MQENELVAKAVEVLRKNPSATDEDIRIALGLRTRVIARAYKIKALERLGKL